MTHLFFIIALFFAAHIRATSARKNGVFYGKNNPNVTDPNIIKWALNIHTPTNQNYRAFYATLFFFSMAFLWETFMWWSIPLSLIISSLTSAVASYSWQKWVNLGSGKPVIDPDERTEYELTIFNRSYWIPKFWYGKRRLYISVGSGILLLTIISWLKFIKPPF